MKLKRFIFTVAFVSILGFTCIAFLVDIGSANSGNTKDITYNKDIAPILYGKCRTCHHPNGVAKLSLLSYKEVRPWARSIKEKVMSREMPPPQSEQLSQKEIDVIEAWVNQGAKEGDAKSEAMKQPVLVAWVNQGAKEGEAKDLPPAPNIQGQSSFQTASKAPKLEIKLNLYCLFPSALCPITLYITKETLSFVPREAPSCCLKPFTVPITDVLSTKIDKHRFIFMSSAVGLSFKIRNPKDPKKPFDIGYFASPDSSVDQKGKLIEGSTNRQTLESVVDVVNQNINVLAMEEEARAEAVRKAELARQEAERRVLPADLKTSVEFDDSQSFMKTGRLDAGKKAELIITVNNQGQGPAYDVALSVSADNPQVSLPASQPIGEIAPGKSQQIRVPIEASLGIPSGELNVFVEAKERRGYDARKVKFVIPMVRLEKPLLAIDNVLINDGTTGLARGNGNKIPESGETIELIVFVKNSGSGPAAAELALLNIDSGIEVLQKSTPLGLLQPNQTGQGKLVLTIPRTYSGKTVTLNIRVADGRGESVASASRQVALNVISKTPTLGVITRMISRGAELQELTNDQTVELEITPENSGALDAVDVAINVSAPEVILQKAQTQIGLLRAGEKGAPWRLNLTVPRAFTKSQLPIKIELSQKDFSGWATVFNAPVKPQLPLLSYKFNLLGRVGGIVIEQNETADLEVQIFNNGDLAAKDTQTMLEVTTPGAQIQGEKMISVGLIAPKSQAVARFKIHLLRSVRPGELPVQLKITQTDFASITDIIRLNVREELPDVTSVKPLTEPITRPLRHKPVIALAEPREGDFVREKVVQLIGTVADEKAVSRLDITVNGKPVPEDVIRQGLKRRAANNLNGRDQQDFTIPLTLDSGSNEIRITAYNTENESDLHNLVVTRLEDRATASSSIPLLMPQSDVDRYILNLEAVRPNPRRWAVVIGIEQYRKATSVTFASRDAYAVREYAIKALGVPSEQVFFLVDDQATKGEMQLLLEERLQQKVQSGDTVYIYFAGHGIPEVKDGTPYLLPSDGDPQSPRITGYSLEDFYTVLGKLRAEKVIVFLDTCFSGLKARDTHAESLLPNTRPGVIKVKNPVLRYPNLVSFAAAGNNQLSNAYKKEAHGLFTYFLLKGLSGDARKGTNKLYLSELTDYVIKQVIQVSQQIFGENLHQTPGITPEIDAQHDIMLKEK